MPRMKKPSSERLNDSINVPVNRALKKRVLRLAGQEPGAPPFTRFARTLIEEGVDRREQGAAMESQSEAELVAATK